MGFSPIDNYLDCLLTAYHYFAVWDYSGDPKYIQLCYNWLTNAMQYAPNDRARQAIQSLLSVLDIISRISSGRIPDEAFKKVVDLFIQAIKAAF